MTPVGPPADKTEGADCRAMIPKGPVRSEGLEKAPYALAWALHRGGSTTEVRHLTSVADAREGRLSAGELWLWVGEVADPLVNDMLDLGQILDEVTLARLARLARKQKLSVGIAHASVRLLLGAVLDHPPNEFSFGLGTHGKPHLVSPRASPEAEGLHFNLSHTEGAVAVALARDPVGVDIEIQRDLPDPDFLEIAETVFAPATVAAVANAASGPQRRSLFYRHWTLGEALIKATGGGFSHDLKSFAFTSQGEPKLSHAGGEFGRAEHWAFGIHGVGS